MDMTQLQKEFVLSCLRRPGLDPFYLGYGITATGARRIYRPIYEAALGSLSEAAIKAYLIGLIKSYDICAEDKTEAIRLLQFSQTAFTDKQRQTI